MPHKDREVARFLGFDLSTTALSVGARTLEGKEGFISIPIKGATKWNNQPAFDLKFLAEMIAKVLKELQRHGWSFHSKGSLSFSIRQHDMVLLDENTKVLIPALSWQCNAAEKETRRLKQLGVEKVVGKIEERFILPKLAWALKKMPPLHTKIYRIMTTGDFIGFMMTGILRLSTSDALSNGLLNQKNKLLAIDIIRKAELEPKWFPPVIQSGERLGVIHPNLKADSNWNKINKILKGWNFVAGLGDNHASGIGCGLKDFNTIVISAGTSGTIIRQSHPFWNLSGKAACFEYDKSRLLLMILLDCASWYDRFVKLAGKGYVELNALALKADIKKLQRLQGGTLNAAKSPEDIASIQASIALELIRRVKDMLSEIRPEPPQAKIKRFVLTGGLSQSLFFQQAILAGLKVIAKGKKLFLSRRKGPLAFKSAVSGALINAMKEFAAQENFSFSKIIPDLSVAKPLGNFFKRHI